MSEPVFEKISEDERGANYRVLLPNGQELVLIYTKAGYSRGGHSHNTPEVAMVLTGRLRVTQLDHGRRVSSEVAPGRTYRNEPGVPHYGTALEDSWLIDFKIDSKADEFKTIDYLPFRELVKKK